MRDILSLFPAQLAINEGGIISVVLFLSSLHFHQEILITRMQECAGSIQHCGRWRWNRRNYCWPVLQCHCVSFDLCALSNNFLRRLIFWSFWMTRKWKSPPQSGSVSVESIRRNKPCVQIKRKLYTKTIQLNLFKNRFAQEKRFTMEKTSALVSIVKVIHEQSTCNPLNPVLKKIFRDKTNRHENQMQNWLCI